MSLMTSALTTSRKDDLSLDYIEATLEAMIEGLSRHNGLHHGSLFYPLDTTRLEAFKTHRSLLARRYQIMARQRRLNRLSLLRYIRTDIKEKLLLDMCKN
jgi:hypothetical protein